MRIFILLALGLLPALLWSQESRTEKKIEVGQWRFGLGVNAIITPERSKRPIIASSNPDTIGGGGSFGDNYLSFHVSRVFSLDKKSNLRLPLALEFLRFSAAEELLLSTKLAQRYKNAANIFVLSNGIEYDVFEFYEGTGYLFVGAGIDLNYVFGRSNETETDYFDFPELSSTDVRSKDDAWRIGARATIGIQGDFQDDVKFNITASVIGLNLIQLNETPGGLLHPTTGWPDGDEGNVLTYRLAFGMIVTLYD